VDRQRPNRGTKLIEYVCSDVDLESRAYPSILITFEKPKTGHNAGDLQFGPDGFLWASFGEAGMYSKKMLEKLEGSLLGTIIRIDVRNTSDGKLYSIPEDNPKFDDPKVRPEVYARGFRNPWRWNFIDDKTILVGDVGRNDWEELNLVKGGEHFGWPVMEGFDCVPPEKNVKCNSEGLKEPMVSFSHEVLRSVIGGVVYNGSQIPWLKGKVIFADYLRGVMSVPLSKRGVVTKKWDQDLTFLHPKLPMKFGPNKGRTILPVDFFLGTDNEVYITAISGGVYKMVPISFWQSLRGFLYMLTSFR
jgi:glucose/arabinose dehydrogenase